MVKSEALFCRLISIDTVIAFNGVVPSAADFQLRLVTLIEQFSKALLTEDHSPKETEGLCLAICLYFDRRLTGNEQSDPLGWKRYSLQHYFYGYDDDLQRVSMVSRLKTLLSTKNDTMFRYAWKLLMQLKQIEGESGHLVTLRTAHRERYFSRSRHWVAPDEEPASESILSHEPVSSPQLMVFIIGPFADKWFRQFDLSTTQDGRIVWVVVKHAQMLVNRLAHMEKTHLNVALRAFFPILTDGFADSSIMIEQITAWQYALASAQLPKLLPCQLAFYSRLSQQRYPHDPDRALWSGSLPLTDENRGTLESQLVDLVHELDARDDGSDLYAIQRHALVSTMLTWLAEQRIMSVLHNLFDSTQLRLAGVTFADHGLGFTRHGAWSLWLADKYGILPGLAATLPVMTLPALPEYEPQPIPAQAVQTVSATESSRPRPPTSPETPRVKRKRRWPSIMALLVLLASLAAVSYYYLCANEMAHWWPLQKPPLLLLSGSAVNAAMPLFISDVTPLFERGSSKLVVGSEKTLAALIPEMLQPPRRMYLIIGHADNTGTATQNHALSIERATVVRDWLIKQTDLPASNFIVDGAGNSRPVASNDTREGRAKNRRVEIIPLPLQGN